MKRPCWATALLFAVGLPLSAQETSRSDAWLKHIKPGAMVRFHIRGRGRVAGPLRGVGVDSVVVGPAFGYSETDTAVALAGVDSAWVLAPRGRTGLLIGGFAGGVFGLAIGSQQLRLCPLGGTCAGNSMGGMLIGGSIGALLGWLIGSSDLHWVQRMP